MGGADERRGEEEEDMLGKAGMRGRDEGAKDEEEGRVKSRGERDIFILFRIFFSDNIK